MTNNFSEHTKKYLEINKSKGLGNGFTISTYVSKYCKVGLVLNYLMVHY